MFLHRVARFSVGEINEIFPDEWVAISVTDTDSDGFAIAGEVIVHDPDERFVWPMVRLGDPEEPVYVFHTEPRRTVAE